MPPPQPMSSADFPRASNAVDPVQAQRVDLVERLELALRIPPAVRERAEFFQFLRIGVHAATL